MAGTTAQFEVEIRDSTGNVLTGRTVSWLSSNTTVAEVSSFGLVTALTDGSVTITATSEGVSGSAAVSVTAATSKLTGTPIYPGESIQEKVNNAVAGTSFVIMSGVHRRQTIIPKDGQKFIGESGAILDGEGVTRHAFSGTASNVTVRGLTIQHYANPNQTGAIQLSNHSGSTASGWLVENNVIQLNYGVGVRIGSRLTLRNNKVIRNRQLGVGGIGDDVLIEGNEIAYNNPDNAVDPGWEAGGTKFVRTNRLIVRGNFVHHNTGSGLWTDILNYNTLYENNRVEDNTGPGIFHEISFDAVISNNQVRRNGTGDGHPYKAAGIRISNSENVTVENNIVEWNDNGIIGMQQSRTEYTGWNFKLRNVRVIGNTVKMAIGFTGVVRDDGDDLVFSANSFSGNHYTVGTGKLGWWAWANGARSWSQWQGYRQDLTGSAGSI